jgi:hypothetical protein
MYYDIRIMENLLRKYPILLMIFMLVLLSCERKPDAKAVFSSSIEPEAGMNPQLDEFARQVGTKMGELGASSGQKASELQAELSAYIAEQTQALMNQGVSITEIQDALQAAAGRVEQTYAPDADEFDGDMGERLEPPLSVFTFLMPFEEAAVAAFTAGDLDEAELMERIALSPDLTPLEMTEGLDLVLGDFGRNQALCDAIVSGEIVAGSDGEAFIPEYLTVKEADGQQYAASDPAVFKSSGEVRSIAALLQPFDQETFFKKADIKKLLESGWLDGYDPRSVKKEAAYIIDELWKEFTALREVYRRASEQGKGMFIFTGYEGEETEINKDNENNRLFENS